MRSSGGRSRTTCASPIPPTRESWLARLTRGARGSAIAPLPSGPSGRDQLFGARLDAQRPQPVQLSKDDRHVVTELDQLRLTEARVEPLPHRVVRQVRIPGNCLGPGERGALAVIQPLGVFE